MFDVRNDPARQTLSVRLSGLICPDEMREVTRTLEALSDGYRGAPHFCLLDVRGLTPLEPEAAVAFSRAMAAARQRGLLLCAHVSDDTRARLEALQSARAPSVDNPGTTDCISPEEATRVLLEERARLARVAAAHAR